MLAALLAHDFPGAVELREQARSVLASQGCTCGCGSIFLHVPVPCLPAPVRSRMPVEGTALGADGEPAGILILFVDDGVLSELELAPLEDGSLPMPPPHRVTNIGSDDSADDDSADPGPE